MALRVSLPPEPEAIHGLVPMDLTGSLSASKVRQFNPT